MKNWICLVLLLSGLVEQSMAQVKKPTSSVGHAIQVSLKPYQNTKIYIGTNYGNNKVLADSCVLNEKSEGVFKGAQKLTPGIYFLVNPKYNILFDKRVPLTPCLTFCFLIIYINIIQRKNQNYLKISKKKGAIPNKVQHNFKPR